MFLKSKLKVWVGLLVLCFLVQIGYTNIPKYISNKMEEKRQESVFETYKIDIRNNVTNIKNQLSTKVIKIDEKNVKLISSTQDPDIIISKNKENLEGYETLENYLYVPMVMIANKNLRESSQEYFSCIEDKYSKDMKYLLEAIEKDLTWEDVGLDDSYVIENTKEKVSMIIPNKYNQSYENIRNYFILALNNYQYPDNTQYDSLSKRVDNILSKCKKVENVSSLISDSFKGIIFCEESIVAEQSKMFSSSSRPTIIAPTSTTKTDYNVYIKSEKKELIKKIIISPEFISLTGFRNIEYNNISESKSYQYSLEIFNFVEDLNTPNINETTDLNEIESNKKKETKELETEESIETQENEETQEEISENSNNENEDKQASIQHMLFVIIFIILVSFLCTIVFLT